MRKFFTFFAVLFIAVAAYATEDTKTLYCKVQQSWWTDGSAAVGIYAWGEGVDAIATWPGVRMEKVEGQPGVWKYDLPTKYTSVIFTRVNPSDEGGFDWGAKTKNLTVPTDDKDLFTITSETAVWGDPGADGEWSIFVPVTPVKFYIAGDDKLVGEEKAWQSDGLKVKEDSYTFENLPAGNYQFKITVDGTWNTEKGFEDLTPELRAAELYLNGGNIGFTLAEAGDVTITYIKDVVFKVEGAFVLPKLQLIGIKGWDGDKDAIDFVPADNHLTASVTETLDEWYYEFKLIYAGSWIGKKTGDDPENLYVLKNDWTSVDGLSWDGYNIVLKMVEGDYVPGKYTFTWTYATGELTVTFPDTPSAIDNTDAAAKATKVVRNGMLLIEKNGHVYNVLGTMVK